MRDGCARVGCVVDWLTVSTQSTPSSYVGKGGSKLAFALDAFAVDPQGRIAADLGSHIGGFVDCLLQRGAAKVYSVDTSYGTLAWKLRTDPRVVVMERANAMHVRLPEPVDIVTVDVGWTRQRAILPHALELLKPGGVAISLLKSQYEADPRHVRRGRLDAQEVWPVVRAAIDELLEGSLPIVAAAESPIRGGRGNVEAFLLVRKPSEA